MKYEALLGNTWGYPSHNINPKEKGQNWCMQYAKAAYADFSFGVPKGVFANNQGDYEKFRMYSLGKQPNSPYKKWSGVDEQTNNTWLSNDWTIRAIVSTYRDKALSRCMKQRHGIVATPIDILAKSEMQQMYADLKAKLIMRQQMQQQGAPQELLNNPAVSLNSGEPQDIEELEMRVMMGEQFNRSKDAELAINYGLEINQFETVRQTWFKDGFDLGVMGYKEWLGEDNKPKFRAVNPENVVVSFTRDPFFRDIVHAGEVIYVPLVELATVRDKNDNVVFSNEELQEFAGTICGKFGNPTTVPVPTVGKMIVPFDKFKCPVLDIEFYTYDEYVYYNTIDESGSLKFRRAEYERGKESDKYTRKRYQMVYKCKWVVGTDKCYDWGPVNDQKRSNDPSKYAYTSLSYKFCAYNFYEMKAQGFMERLIPYLDDYQMTRLKIQNFKNRAVPSGWWLDLDALENVALNKGGKNMEPKELLQMFFETGVLVGRSKDTEGNPMGPNWKPVIPIENTAASELAMFYQDLVTTIGEIERITGYNDITSGNPNPKTLTSGYEVANESTNDALYPLVNSVTYLTECLAKDVLKRVQQGLKKGELGGYSTSINMNSLQMLTLSKDICDREYGIMLQERTTEEQKAWLFQQMQADIMNGFLDSSDAVTLINTHNVKEAQVIWAYKVKKNKEQQQQNELQKIQLNNQGAQQAAQIGQQMKLQETVMQNDFTFKIEKMRIEAEIMKEQMRIESQERIALMNNQAKITASSIDHDGKVTSAETQGQAKVTSTILQGQLNKEKQLIANQKSGDNEKTEK